MLVVLFGSKSITEVIFKINLATSISHSKSPAWLDGQSNDGIVTVVNHETFPFGQIPTVIVAISEFGNRFSTFFLSVETTIRVHERKVSIRKIFPFLAKTRRAAIN